MKIQSCGVGHTPCKSKHGVRSMNTGEITHGSVTFGLAPRSSRYICFIKTSDLTYTAFCRGI